MKPQDPFVDITITQHHIQQMTFRKKLKQIKAIYKSNEMVAKILFSSMSLNVRMLRCKLS